MDLLFFFVCLILYILVNIFFSHVRMRNGPKSLSIKKYKRDKYLRKTQYDLKLYGMVLCKSDLLPLMVS